MYREAEGAKPIDNIGERVLRVQDIMRIFRVSETLAYKRIREIRSISDIYGMSGRVTEYDYNQWLTKRKTMQ